MESSENGKKVLSEDELGTITAGAAVEKGQMMKIKCENCQEIFYADVKKKVVKCKKCKTIQKIFG